MCGCNRMKSNGGGGGGDGGGEGFQSYSSYSDGNPLPTVDSSEWGPPTWKALHIASVHSPNLGTWKELLAALGNDLPCPECRAHYREWYSNNPLQITFLPIQRMMRTTPNVGVIIVTWVLRLHNDVNLRTSTEELPKSAWSRQQIYDTYGGDRATRLAEGREALATVQGVIGERSYEILSRLLN